MLQNEAIAATTGSSTSTTTTPALTSDSSSAGIGTSTKTTTASTDESSEKKPPIKAPETSLSMAAGPTTDVAEKPKSDSSKSSDQQLSKPTSTDELKTEHTETL